MTNNVPPYIVFDYSDPFQLEKFTRLIHFTNTKGGYSSTEKAALLSRYSRSTKSMIDLIESEFRDKNRAPAFITKLLSEYGDDSIAELANETVGIEGISLLAASKLTNHRIGVSFLEKSTRYVPFTADSFYTPEAIFEMGMVDEYKELCGVSYKTFNFIYNDLLDIFDEKYPIDSCSFYNSQRKREVLFSNLISETDIKNAEKAHKRAIKDKAFDIAGYSWLTSLKTNIGLNANARALEYLLLKTKQSPLSELNYLYTNLYDLLSQSIHPFIQRLETSSSDGDDMYNNSNPLEIYKNNNKSSIQSVYKHNIANLLKSYDYFHNTLDQASSQEEADGEDLEEDNKPSSSSVSAATKGMLNPAVKRNTDLVKALLSEIGMKSHSGGKIQFKETKSKNMNTVDSESFRSYVKMIDFKDEQSSIDMLCASILFENNENLLDYDSQNINNIDENLRIIDVDKTKIKSGILFDIINNNRTMEDLYIADNYVNKTTENTLSFNDFYAYWEENMGIKDKPIYQNYHDKNELTINKEQLYLIQKYIGDRKSRRSKLGRAFEFIDYQFEVSSSFRIMREFKRHRLASSIYPPVVTARNSFDSFIFPNIIIQQKHLFDEYKYLIERSFDTYSKIVKKSGSYSDDYHTAQYALPISTRCNYITKMNLRQLDHLLSLRTTPQVHEEFRYISQALYDILLIVHPNLAKMLEFVDLGDHPLGRLRSEFRKEEKINNNNIGEI